MALKDEFTRQLEAQVAVWQAQIKGYQERMAEASAEARANHERSVATMHENAAQAERLLGQVRQANEGAWRDMNDASRKAFEDLQKGWATAFGRFV